MQYILFISLVFTTLYRVWVLRKSGADDYSLLGFSFFIDFLVKSN